jgi:peptidoglycan/xylan/chitin deacetylase (PgdA/CDA1 family)
MLNKKVCIIMAIVAVIAGASYYSVRSSNSDSVQKDADITDLSDMYAADAEIQESLEKLSQGNVKPAEVYTRTQDGEHRIAIVFDGLPARADTAKILDSLQKHGGHGVFFVEGQNAADQPETIKSLIDAGQEIGNFTFVGATKFEKMPIEYEIGSLCRTQKIINSLTGIEPALFRAPRTQYTDNLLKAAAACGISHAVKENVALKRGAIHNETDADAFVANLQPGSILSIPLTVPVGLPTMKKGKTDELPAEDRKPTVQDNKVKPGIPPEPLTVEVELLLAALERQGWQMDFVDGFRSIHYLPVMVNVD